jgi:myo-inositol 2-dehydrogenase/D-chiro-inositol 1-dehydrogenase
MGRTHSNAFAQAPHFFDMAYRPVLKTICARNAEKAQAFAEQWGYESSVTDWRKLVDDKSIDLIDIASPNDTHMEIAIAAAQAGKMVMCEKPLGRSAAESRKMVEAVERAGVANMVWYNYRRVPAVTLAKQLIDEGRLGKIFHYRAKFLQDWTISKDLPQGGQGLWRLDVGVAGSGVTGDLLAHCIDTAMWLNGGISSVTGMTETFIKERHHNITGKTEKVGIDDASLFLSRFENGSLGSFEATRYARGHKALYTLEINGEHASIFWDLHDLHRLQYFDHRDEGRTRGWRSVHITDGDHPYMNKWWVPGLQIGYEHTFIHQAADFIDGLSSGKPAAPTFRDALATDLVTDAVLKSAKTGQWENAKG